MQHQRPPKKRGATGRESPGQMNGVHWALYQKPPPPGQGKFHPSGRVSIEAVALTPTPTYPSAKVRRVW